MPDDIKQRLQNSADQCVKSFEAWSKDKKNGGARETLQEAIHELRKVASRLEIEIAVSERDEAGKKPMPIPQNRNAKGRHQKPQDSDGNKNDDGKDSGSKPAKKSKPKTDKADKPGAAETSEE